MHVFCILCFGRVFQCKLKYPFTWFPGTFVGNLVSGFRKSAFYTFPQVIIRMRPNCDTNISGVEIKNYTISTVHMQIFLTVVYCKDLYFWKLHGQGCIWKNGFTTHSVIGEYFSPILICIFWFNTFHPYQEWSQFLFQSSYFIAILFLHPYGQFWFEL